MLLSFLAGALAGRCCVARWQGQASALLAWSFARGPSSQVALRVAPDLCIARVHRESTFQAIGMHPAAVIWHDTLCQHDGWAGRIKEGYARIEELWTYDEFRRRFDAAYDREAAEAAMAAAEK